MKFSLTRIVIGEVSDFSNGDFMVIIAKISNLKRKLICIASSIDHISTDIRNLIEVLVEIELQNSAFI